MLKRFIANEKFLRIYFAGLFFIFATAAQAADKQLNLQTDWLGVNTYKAFSVSQPMATSITRLNLTGENKTETRWFTANKWHQYFGLSSLTLAALTAIVPKPSHDDPESGIHHSLAQAAAALGGAAVVSGLSFHYKDLSWNHLIKDPDNWHAFLGTFATLAYVAAISEAPDESHASYGIAGAVAMLTAIKITW